MSYVRILQRWEGPGHRLSYFKTRPLPQTAPRVFYEDVAPWHPKIIPGKFLRPAPVLQLEIGLDTATLPWDGQIGTLSDIFFSPCSATIPAGAPPSTSSAPSSHISYATHTVTIAAGPIVAAGAAASPTPPRPHLPAWTSFSVDSHSSPVFGGLGTVIILDLSAGGWRAC